jgi:hypothetical protein
LIDEDPALSTRILLSGSADIVSLSPAVANDGAARPVLCKGTPGRSGALAHSGRRRLHARDPSRCLHRAFDSATPRLLGRDRVRLLRRLTALAAAAFVGWGSIADNPVVCPADVAAEAGHHDDGVPTAPHCCISCPCRTPTDAPLARVLGRPVASVTAMVSAPDAIPASADAPAPPTPPPTLLA